MLYTCSTSAVSEKLAAMKHYYVMTGYGNDSVVPDKRDSNLYKKGVMTEAGFVLNYDLKLRSQEAYDWMQRVSEEASHQDVVLIGEDEELGKKCRIMLAEMMISMFGGRKKFRYNGELN